MKKSSFLFILLKQFVMSVKKGSFIFLIETISDVDKLVEIKSKIGYNDCVIIGKRGHSEVLVFTGKMVSRLNTSNHYVDVVVKLERELPYKLIGFYGFANRRDQAKSWAFLKDVV